MRQLPGRVAALVLVASVGLVGCSSDSGSGADGGAASTTGGQAAGITVSEDTDGKPEFEVPSGQTPPDELVTETIVEGEGEAAAPGDEVEVQYVGKAWSTGEEFDASWSRDRTYGFEVGAGNVIRGWDEGVAGMKVGERRMLIIPPAMAYGEAGVGPIGPNETLVFVIDLVSIS